MKNILMVCVGNVCRSPMAEILLQNYSNDHQLNLNVHSAGIEALVGSQADKNVIEILQEKGLDASAHIAKLLTFSHLQEADLVLVMEAWQQKEIACCYPSIYGKVHRLGKWKNLDIMDPYRQSRAVFEEVYLLIESALADWQQRLWRVYV